VIAWALTCLLHSTVLILFAWALARTPWGRAPRVREALWKAALLGALVTATLHQATGGSASLAPSIRMSEPHAAGLRAPLESGVPWLALVWSAASGLAAVRLLCGWLRLRRVTGPRRILSRGPLRRELDAILASAGVTRRVTLSCSRGLAVPRAIGAREICVPIRALRELTPAEQRALLAHETAHLLRRDGAWLFVAAVVQTVAWWQPLTRLAVARLRQSMELCCDDWAAARLPDRMALAECLVKVGEWGVAVPRGLPLAAFTGHRSTLRERVERLVNDDPSGRCAWRTPWLAAVPLLVVFAFAPRVTLAETTMMPALVVPTLLRAEAAMSAVADPERVTPPPARVPRPKSGQSLSRPTPAPPIVSTEPAAGALAMAGIEESPQSPAPAAVSTVITMPDPLVPSSSRLRITSSAVRAVALNAAPPKPDLLAAEDRLERRIGVWLDSQSSHPSTIDPLRPKYLRPEGRSYLTHSR
jgi:beta-lactamase regulating signal transducer with metallopeptidase domain